MIDKILFLIFCLLIILYISYLVCLGLKHKYPTESSGESDDSLEDNK